jgi:D-galactarolactone cycloisomerase
VKITRITICRVEGNYHKFVGMNAGGTKPAGLTYTNNLVRITTDQGIEGVGVMAGSPDAAYQDRVRKLLGADPRQIFEWKGQQVVRPSQPYADLLTRHPHLDGALLDLAGKMNGQPCWKLLGEEARHQIPAYDATIYFSDIWFPDRGARAVFEEVEEALKMGYTALKIKVGRGFRWMDKTAGMERDLEILRGTRKIAGPAVTIMADDNNAFKDDFTGAWQFLRQTGDVNLYWIEEIFPETVSDYGRLKDLMGKAGLKSLIADGENFREPEQFEPYLKPRQLMDVMQLDIRNGGILKCREAGRMAEAAGNIAKPHNWASQIGVLMALHLAKACKGVTGVEDDRSTCDAITAAGYSFHNGVYTVPDTPGLSITVNEEVYKRKYQRQEIVLT